MAEDHFIDGLRTRAEKLGDYSARPKKYGTSYSSYEMGDPLAMRKTRRNIGLNQTPKRRISISAPVEVKYKTPDRPIRRRSAESVKTDREIINKPAQTGSYRHDVLGIDDETLRTPRRRQEQSKEIGLDNYNPRRKSYKRDVLGLDDAEYDINSDDLKKQKRFEKKNQKNFFLRHKVLTGVVAVILVLAIGGFVWGDSIVARITGNRSGLFDFLRSIAAKEVPLKTDDNGRTNILAFGTSGYDMNGTEAETVHDGAQLTDSIMVISIDQNNKDVAMISLPRDLKTPTCTNTEKINELYYCNNTDGNNEEAGAKALKDRVESLLGINIQYFAHVNWTSLIQVVDAIGGITVTVDEDINDPDYTGMVIKAGVPTKMNGEQALALARARHGTAYGDITRGNSQQKILIAIKDKIKQDNLSLTETINLANILGDNLRTDFSADEIKSAAKVFSEADFDSMRQIPLMGDETNYLTTGDINGISYVYPVLGENNYSAIKEYIKNQLTSDPVKLENAKIKVLNGSGVDGMDVQETTELTNSGFNAIAAGSAPSAEYFDKIYLYAINDKPETKAKLETYYGVKALDSIYLPSGIDTGDADFVVILGVGFSTN